MAATGGFDIAIIHLPNLVPVYNYGYFPYIWSLPDIPTFFNVIGFRGTVQTISVDSADKFIAEERHNAKQSVEELEKTVYFHGFFKNDRNSNPMAIYENKTISGISGGGLIFNRSTTLNENKKEQTFLVGCHNASNHMVGLQCGTMIDQKIWTWIENIQTSYQIPCVGLFDAVYQGREREVKIFINQLQYSQRTMMMLILPFWRGNLDIVRMFLERREMSSMMERRGDLYFLYVCSLIYPYELGLHLLEFLLELGVDPVKHLYYKRDLFRCMMFNPLVMRRVIDLGGGPIFKNGVADGKTAMILTMSSGFRRSAPESQCIFKVKCLIEVSADVNEICWAQSTVRPDPVPLCPLIFSVSSGRYKLVKVLLEANANIHIQYPDGTHVLHALIPGRYIHRKERMKIAKLLLEHKADIVKWDANSFRIDALITALQFERREIADLFYNHGARIPQRVFDIYLEPLFGPRNWTNDYIAYRRSMIEDRVDTISSYV